MRMAGAEGRAMRRDRPGASKQPGSARGSGSGGPPHTGSALNHALHLSEKRRRSRVPAGSRAHLGNVGWSEEANLARRLGPEYGSYRDSVPRLLPGRVSLARFARDDAFHLISHRGFAGELRMAAMMFGLGAAALALAAWGA